MLRPLSSCYMDSGDSNAGPQPGEGAPMDQIPNLLLPEGTDMLTWSMKFNSRMSALSPVSSTPFIPEADKLKFTGQIVSVPVL